ncbi:MAG TPA: hypothetical protein VMV49_14195 [Candidatus Deferrimicrobium sp.]|nr:hypothetical protein [Candidatus Deferrimicrobium sp.]
MGKRDYLPVLAIFGMWFMTMASGLSTPGLDSTQLAILSYVIAAPLLLAIILTIRAIHHKNKAEKE